MQAEVLYGLRQVSVMASDVILPRTDQTFVVAILMLRVIAGPGLILTSPVRRSITANLNVGLDQRIGSNLRLRNGIYLCNKQNWPSDLHRTKSSRLNAIKQERKKVHSRNSGDIILRIINN